MLVSSGIVLFFCERYNLNNQHPKSIARDQIKETHNIYFPASSSSEEKVTPSEYISLKKFKVSNTAKEEKVVLNNFKYSFWSMNPMAPAKTFKRKSNEFVSVFVAEQFHYSGEITYDMPWSSQLLIQSSSEYTNLVQGVTNHVSVT